jgi:protoheme IX farnesyltransferase
VNLAVSYIKLMKLRVVELLLVSTLPAMVLAKQGLPSFGLTLATILGGTLAAGSANAFNMAIEADTDKLMKRTANRPTVTGEITRIKAFLFASVIGILSILIFATFTTGLATLITVIAIAYYVLVYTLALKKNTSQNIVWGGAAGCAPVLIGWAAVTNSLSPTAWALFFVIFFWTPPHFWALAIKYKDDYQAAKIPMLPVVASQKMVLNQMWFHTILMVISSIAVLAFAGLQWWTYPVTVALGFVYASQLISLKNGAANYAVVAGKIFQWSITYVSLFSLLLVFAQLLSA